MMRSFKVIVVIFCLINSIKSAPTSDTNLFPLAIIHINDFHARFLETNWQSTTCKENFGEVCIGGYARTFTVVKNLLKERADKNPIYLNIGDNFLGTLWYHLFEWNVTSTFLNYLSADATTLGNHEFDRGIEGVVPFLESLDSPVVAANLDDRDEPSMQGKYKKSIIVERSGRKIGLIGAVTVETTEISSPGKLVFLDPVQSVKDEADRLKAEDNVDIVVVLSHCGLEDDRLIAANGGENIDVIVGGHSHTLLYTGTDVPGPDKAEDVYPIVVRQPNNHKVLIVQASAYTKYVGDLTVYFDDDGEVQKWEGNPIFLDSHIKEDPEIKEKLLIWKQEVDKVAFQEVTNLSDTLSVDECEYDECTIGDFITDSYVFHYVHHPDYQENKYQVYVSIAITHAGTIRTSLNPGLVNYDDLFTAMPFQDTVDTLELKGEHVKELLEYSASSYNFYNFIQVSGLRVIYNISQPINSRVMSVKVLSRDHGPPKYEGLDEKSWYRMAVPGFLAQGGNGFTMFLKSRNHRKGEKKDVDIIGDYLKMFRTVAQKIDGRIKVFK